MRRYRIRSDDISVQEVDGMYAIKIYFTLDELSDLVKEKLSEKDRQRFENSMFVPIKIGVNDSDLTVNATFVSTQKRWNSSATCTADSESS